MPINDDDRLLDLACFSKSPRACDTHRTFQPWSGPKKKFKEYGFEGVSNYLSCQGRPNVSCRPCCLACNGKTLKV